MANVRVETTIGVDTTEAINEFMEREWRTSNKETFGRQLTDGEMSQPFIITAWASNEEMIGVARCKIVGRTVRVHQLLTKTEYRGKLGVGRKILAKVEQLCQKNGYHKIRLSTSENHNNLDFYKKVGFHVEATLDNDAFGFKWYILSKFVALREEI